MGYDITDHEQGMIGTGTDNSDLDAVLGIPLKKSERAGGGPSGETLPRHSHRRRRHCHGC